jgi:hypothetical protein
MSDRLGILWTGLCGTLGLIWAALRGDDVIAGLRYWSDLR